MNPANLNSIALQWDLDSHQFAEVPLNALAWSALDLGVQYGAILVERIRTFGGKLPELSLHRDRLARGLHALQIELPFAFDSFPNALIRLLECNREWMAEQQDASIVFAVSPGSEAWGPGSEAWSIEGCTCMMHLLPLPWKRLRTWYSTGTELIRSPWLSGAGVCWPADIKARSRLNYFLADRSASRIGPAVSLLSTQHGTVSDTSVANLLMIDDQGRWVSPRREEIVLGTSLLHAEGLLRTQGIAIEFRDLAWEELSRALELVLVGNSGCAWHARSIDGQLISDGQPGNGSQLLQRMWIERFGFDWLSQAIHHPDS